MIIPAAEFIEVAHDQLEKVDPMALRDQRQELHEAIGCAVSENYARGYALGLQTARVMLETMPAAVAAGVKL